MWAHNSTEHILKTQNVTPSYSLELEYITEESRDSIPWSSHVFSLVFYPRSVDYIAGPPHSCNCPPWLSAIQVTKTVNLKMRVHTGKMRHCATHWTDCTEIKHINTSDNQDQDKMQSFDMMCVKWFPWHNKPWNMTRHRADHFFFVGSGDRCALCTQRYGSRRKIHNIVTTDKTSIGFDTSFGLHTI